MKSSTLQRVAAVDVFRALTMFFMLFVNDIPGLKNVPHWLMHAEMNEDMMGFSDTIFPAFLFCMGMSIPFAIQNRVKKGDTALQIISHISESNGLIYAQLQRCRQYILSMVLHTDGHWFFPDMECIPSHRRSWEICVQRDENPWHYSISIPRYI